MKHMFVLLAACAFVTLARAQSLPPHSPNSTKYRDSGIPNATARSGSAAIEARALLGRDGLTDLQVTTGSLSGGTAPGNIDKVQLKRIIDNRTIVSNDNNLNDGGVYNDRLSGMARHDALAIQATVSGIDPSRSDLVSANETVKLRPDLTVTDLQLPPLARINVPLTIRATVREQNGDVGARANCTLSVDGTITDRADGIWVDANDAVTCAFSTLIATAGTHTISVAATGVAPGDWDLANNVASGSLAVTSDSFTSWSAEGEERKVVQHSVWDAPWRHDETSYTFESQHSAFFGYVEQPMNLDTVSARMTLSTNGSVIEDTSLIPVTRNGTQEFGCFYGFDDTTKRSITGCGTSTLVNGQTVGFVYWNANRDYNLVTYVAHGFDDRYIDIGGSYYMWNYASAYETGIRQTWGDSLTFDVVLTDGEKTFHATPTVTFDPFEYGYAFGPTCYDDATYGGTVCSSFTNSDSGRRGHASSN
ncbi:MAG TPA: hypothetical protein VFN10_10690 [Thermoanaerobaculia bacterium]|nr:hypothetical protein [Thermoanaerobaculia bacterium]